jgi:hypothetical protein
VCYLNSFGFVRLFKDTANKRIEKYLTK